MRESREIFDQQQFTIAKMSVKSLYTYESTLWRHGDAILKKIQINKNVKRSNNAYFWADYLSNEHGNESGQVI